MKQLCIYLILASMLLLIPACMDVDQQRRLSQVPPELKSSREVQNRAFGDTLVTRKLNLIYQTDFSSPTKIVFEDTTLSLDDSGNYFRKGQPAPGADWIAEGKGSVQVKEGKLWVEASSLSGQEEHTRSYKPDQSTIVVWNGQVLPQDLLLEFSVGFSEAVKGQMLIYFCATGPNNKDIFDPQLPPRRGIYRNYYNGVISNYNYSFDIRPEAGPKNEKTEWLVKNPGGQQIAKVVGTTPVTSAQEYHFRILKIDGNIEVEVNGVVLMNGRDDQALGKGQIGLGIMEGKGTIWVDDFKVWGME